MSTYFYVGIGLIAVASAQLVWAVRSKAPTHFFATSVVFGELGVMALAIALITDKLAVTVVVAMLGLGLLVSVWMQIRLVRQWRRDVAQ